MGGARPEESEVAEVATVVRRRAAGGSPLRRRRLLGAAGSASAGAALVAACGLQGSGAPSGGPSQEPVTLEFQHRWEGARTDVVEQVVASYRALHPQVKIESQMVFGDGPGFFDGMPYDKILAQIAAGTPPDVVMMGSDIAAAWARKGGALRPLDEALKRDKIEPEKVFYPALAQMARAPGNYFGLPQLTATDRAYLFMNKDVLEGLGLPTATGPASWDDLVAWSQKVTVRDGDSFSQVGLDVGGTPFIDWITRNNGRVLSEDGTRVAFDSPAGQGALQWMVESTQRLYGSRKAYTDFVRAQKDATYTGKVNLWIGQAAAFFVTMTDGPKANPAFKAAVSIVPANTSTPQAKPLSLAEKIWMYSQPAGTSGARLEAGFDFLKYLTLGAGNKAFVLAQGRPSPVVKLNEDPAFRQANPWWDTVVKQGLSLMTPMAQTPAWNAMRTVLTTMTDQVLSGQKGVREGLAGAAQECQRLLDEASR
jgi:ABC-type glycerol-3-phosphate transport system substrate-binding protein